LNHPRTAVILAAHGSSGHAGHAAIVRRLADALVERGLFEEAGVAFWKQAPHFRDALDTVRALDVTVIPLFSSSGYYVSQVLPREMGLQGPLTRKGDRVIRCTRPPGEHPAIADLLGDVATHALHEHKLHPHETAVVVVGHGTTRNPRSGDTTYVHAAALRRRLDVNEVVAVFLDQPPQIEQAYALTRSRNLLVAPFLIGGAGHEREDIPRRLCAAGDTKNAACPLGPSARRVVFLPALGEHPGLVDVLVDLVRDAGPLSAPAGGPGGNEREGDT
jgi:sirohydrochlorin cobaltochelatase